MAWIWIPVWSLTKARYDRGPEKTCNYLLEGGPLVVQVPPLGECSGNPSVSEYNLALLWEAAFGFSGFFFFFGRPFQRFCPFHDGWFTSTPAHTAFSVQQFLTKNYLVWPPCPTLPIRPISPWETFLFCFPGWKKSWKGNIFWCGRGETKNSRTTKRHQYWRVPNCFERWKACLSRCIASNGGHFEGDWSLNMRINAQCLINKFQVFGGPPLISNFSGPQFPNLWNGNDKSTCLKMVS